jgi:AcrR family transcriptional regulator
MSRKSFRAAVTDNGMPAKAMKNTSVLRVPVSTVRDPLLDVAERLFVEYSFNGVSVRQIVDHAKVNLSAISYHFGTKENLFKQVLMRRAVPLRDQRRRLIEELYACEPNPPLEDVLYVILDPAFKTNQENKFFR